MSSTSNKVALLSVYDKTGIDKFARDLSLLGYEIYASGGTARSLQESGLKIKDVATLVGGEAILGHRVVTLSREIAAGLLANKNSPQDMAELKKLGIPFIDLVCVDMYPLEETINRPGVTLEQVTAQTDIGGPTILRSAAKGRRIVVSSRHQREGVIEWLKSNQPNKDAFVSELAARAEYEVARYITISAKYLNQDYISGELHALSAATKYGENPQQLPAAFYADNRGVSDPLGLDKFEHLQGMERSFINMTDIDRLTETCTHIAAGFDINFNHVPKIAVGVKHGNACGAGIADNHIEAIKKMLLGDTRAIFGGVVMINGHISKQVAETLIYYGMEKSNKRLLDGVVGSGVDTEALKVLSRNKLRVITNPALNKLGKESIDKSRRLRRVRGGLLEQPGYEYVIDTNADYIDYFGKFSLQQKKDLVLGWAIGSTSNSNTITIVKDSQLIGNGVGQQDRVGAGQLALTRTTNRPPEFLEDGEQLKIIVNLDKQKLEGASAYSDSFFPFPDGPEILAIAGIKAILSSSGSVGDEAVISLLKKYKVSLMMVPDKIGRGFYMH